MLKPGDVFVSDFGRTVTVDAVNDDSIIVTVERVVGKNDATRIEKRKRTVPRELIPVFLQSYRGSDDG